MRFMSSAPRFEERSHEETSKQESWARRAAWDLAKNIYKLEKSGSGAMFVFSYSNEGNACAYFNITRGKRIRGGLRSFYAHAERRGFKLR